MGARGLAIRDDMGAAELRRFAQGEADRRAALRALAIAQALEGASRADAARVVGRERQSLRDAVLRYNTEGLAAEGGFEIVTAERQEQMARVLTAEARRKPAPKTAFRRVRCRAIKAMIFL